MCPKFGKYSGKEICTERMTIDIKFNPTTLQNGGHPKVVRIHKTWTDLLSPFPETVIRPGD